jgi:hypothetical protein
LPFFVRQNVTTKLSQYDHPKKLPVWGRATERAPPMKSGTALCPDGPAAKRQKTGQPAIGSDARVR